MWKRQAQVAADAAAQAGIIELKRTGSAADSVTAAKADAAANNFGEPVSTITVQTPPQSGGHQGNARYLMATVGKPVPTYFLRFFGYNNVSVSATAESGMVAMDSCIFVLDKQANNSFQVSGTPEVSLSCGVQVNSSSPSAMQVTGGAVLSGTSFNVVGGTQITGGASVTPAPGIGMSPEDDPLAYRANPTFGGCDYTNFKVTGAGKKGEESSPIYLDPGVYCGGIDIHSGRPVILNSGLYVLAGGGMSINAQSTVTGTDVTFFNTETASKGHGAISITGGAVISLRAPRAGPQEGMLIWEDRSVFDNGPNHIDGHSSSSIEGVIYMPNSDLNYAGGSNTDAQYANIVVSTLKFTGHSRFGSNFTTLSKGAPLVKNVLVQ